MAIDFHFMKRLMRSVDEEVERFGIELTPEEVARRFAFAINAGERDATRIRALTLGIDAPPVSWLFH